MDKIPPPFDQLIGQELSAVTFVRDYIQLQFNPPPMLNVMTPITLELATSIVSQNDPAFPGALIAQIGRSIISIEFRRDQYFRLVFSDDTRITISLKPQEYVGAEALYYSGLGGEWGVL